MRDLAERAGWTFAQTFLAIVLASGVEAVNVGTLRAAAVGGLAAALSAVKTYAQQRTSTPS